ncbi:MAG: propionyl-CoA synthetase [Gammaproteobacteria bacterium]|nr:propionyl-CoA synthetase [Gammaproteobacteria bacterium]MDD9894909.1 propionyl-CoA synthetase [Gammaproteobacteria bacterium]
MSSADNDAFEQTHHQSLSDPEKFWGSAAEEIHWTKKPNKILDTSESPHGKWFVDGELNTCYNALDRHVEAGRGEHDALIYDSPVTNTIKKYSFAELLEQTSRFAGVLRSAGVEKGDRVIIYMPMIPETVIAMLACARIGAIHGVVFGGFAANELAVRIDDAEPKLIVTATCGIEVNRVIPYMPLLNGAIDIASHKPSSVIVFARPEADAELIAGRDIDWCEAMAMAEPVECVPLKATDPLYILYTSGTTGIPKGVVRDNGGHAVALNWTMKAIYNVEAGDVYWAASDVGWVVGHSYIVYGPLLKGCTTILFEGKPVGTPDAGVFWRVIAEHKVKSLFTAPTAFRAIKKEDPDAELLKQHDLSNFEILFLAGERTDPDTLHWAEDKLGRPVIDHWWQTETGWSIAANCMGLGMLPVKAGSPTKAAPGWQLDVLDENCNPLPSGEVGALCGKLPMPPGSMLTLWNAPDRFVESYFAEFPGYYKTADAGFIDEDGYVFVMSRTDDIINVAGHRLSTGGMEEVLTGHPDVAECAVIGVADQLKGQLPVGFLVLKAGVLKESEEIVAECVQRVREQIGPVAAFKQAAVVARLPKTRSGKILRGTMQKIADNEAYRMPATIDDPIILDEIDEALQGLGLSKARD